MSSVLRGLVAISLVAAALPAAAVSASAATPGQLDPSFNPVFDSGPVVATAIQPNGEIVAGGMFNVVDGAARPHVVRLSGSGAVDPGFNSGANAGVYAIAVQPDGKIIIGGQFTTVSGTSRNHIARLNPDGTLDGSFNSNVNGDVNSLALQPDGRILVGGDFTQAGGQPRRAIARLTPDGALDSSFNLGADELVNAIAVQPNGQIVVGGRFANIDGAPQAELARVNSDGSLDAGFDPVFVPGGVDDVQALSLQPDGKIVVGGRFATIDGVPHPYIARLDASGTPEPTFNPNLASGNNVYSTALQPDGKVLIGGAIETIAGVTRNGVARLNANGSLDESFNPDANDTVDSIFLQPDGQAVIGGEFTTVSGVARRSIARVTASSPTAAPTSPSATAGNGQATVSWTAVPGSITSYTATASPGGQTCTTAGSTCTVTGLTNGATYAFTVTAANDFGSGPASAKTAAVTPSAPEPPPLPSNAFTVRKLGTSATAIRTSVRVPGPGTVFQRGVVLSRGAKLATVACRSESKKPRREGSTLLACRLTQAVRESRARGYVRVLLTTTYRPTGGDPNTRQRVIRLPRIKPRFTG